MYSEYLPTNKKVQDLLDRHVGDFQALFGMPVVHLTGMKYKMRKENGWHYLVHAMVDRKFEVELLIQSPTADCRSQSNLIDVKTCINTNLFNVQSS